MQKLIQKLASRKFWMAAAGVVTGIAMAFGVESNSVTTVAGAVTAVASVITYVLAEGRIDAASVKTAVEKVQTAAEAVAGEDRADGAARDRS